MFRIIKMINKNQKSALRAKAIIKKFKKKKRKRLRNSPLSKQIVNEQKEVINKYDGIKIFS